MTTARKKKAAQLKRKLLAAATKRLRDMEEKAATLKRKLTKEVPTRRPAVLSRVLLPRHLRDARTREEIIAAIKAGTTLVMTGGIGHKHWHPRWQTQDIQTLLGGLDPCLWHYLDASDKMRRYNGYERRSRGTARKNDKVYEEVSSHPDFGHIYEELERNGRGKKIILICCNAGRHRSVALCRTFATNHASIQMDLVNVQDVESLANLKSIIQLSTG